MVTPSDFLLTSTNYFSGNSIWRMCYKVKDWITLGKEKSLIDVKEKSNGMIRMTKHME